MSYGTAEITITQMSDGKIFVNHSDGNILSQWDAKITDWDEIWETLDRLKNESLDRLKNNEVK